MSNRFGLLSKSTREKFGMWMIVLIVLILAAVGTVLVIYLPALLAFGVALIVIAAILMLQAVAIWLVSFFIQTSRNADSKNKPPDDTSELSRLITRYRNLKYFLAKLAGVLGLVWGIATHSLYFTILGAAATTLFYVLDRMESSRNCDTERVTSTPY